MTNLLKTLHVLFASFWVGGIVVFEILGGRARKSKDPIKLAAFGDQAGFLGKAFFPLTSILTWVFGLILTFQGGYTWAPWLYWGIIVVIVTTILGAGVIGPAAKKLQSGQAGADAPKLAKRMSICAHINTALLILTVFDMVMKPGA